MIETIGNVVFSLVFTSILGIGAGGIMCLALRKQWSFKEALIDAALATVIGFVATFLILSIDTSGEWESIVILVLAIPVGSVVVRHLLQFALRTKE